MVRIGKGGYLNVPYDIHTRDLSTLATDLQPVIY